MRQPEEVHPAEGDSSGDTHDISVLPAAVQLAGPGIQANMVCICMTYSWLHHWNVGRNCSTGVPGMLSLTNHMLQVLPNLWMISIVCVHVRNIARNMAELSQCHIRVEHSRQNQPILKPKSKLQSVSLVYMIHNSTLIASTSNESSIAICTSRAQISFLCLWVDILSSHLYLWQNILLHLLLFLRHSLLLPRPQPPRNDRRKTRLNHLRRLVHPSSPRQPLRQNRTRRTEMLSPRPTREMGRPYIFCEYFLSQ